METHNRTPANRPAQKRNPDGFEHKEKGYDDNEHACRKRHQ